MFLKLGSNRRLKMTNRNKLDTKLLNLSDRSLAHYLATGVGCVECPAKDLCHAEMCEELSCEQTLEVWLKQDDESENA